jgi:hypothetical protein
LIQSREMPYRQPGRDLEEAGGVREYGFRAAQSTRRSRFVTPFDTMDYYD